VVAAAAAVGAAAASVGGPPAARAETIGLVAADNAYVLRSAPDTDQGESQSLATKRLNDSNTRVAYLRFNLANFVNTHTASDLASVNLRLTQTAGAADTVRVWGLLESAANGGTTEGNWTEALTWNTQPAGALANASTALPNSSTTATLAATPVDATANVTKDIPLSLSDFQSFLSSDTNGQLTLLFTNNANNNMSWASRTNTNGFTPPTLLLEVVPEPGAAAALSALAACGLLARRRRRV
jgi:hypothetical protein